MVKVFFSFLFVMFLTCDFAYAVEFSLKNCKNMFITNEVVNINYYRIDADCKNLNGDYVHTYKNHVFEADLYKLCNVDGRIKSAEYCTVKHSELGKNCNIKKVHTYNGHTQHYRVYADCKNKKGVHVDAFKKYVHKDELGFLCNVDGEIKKLGEEGCKVPKDNWTGLCSENSIIRSVEYCAVKYSKLGKNCNIKKVHTYHDHTQHYRVYADCKNKKGKLVDAFREDVYKDVLGHLCNVDGVITKPGEKGCKDICGGSAEYCTVKNSKLGKNCNIKAVHTYHGHTQHYRVYADCKNEKGKLVDAFKEHVYKGELGNLCNVNGVIIKSGEEGCK